MKSPPRALASVMLNLCLKARNSGQFLRNKQLARRTSRALPYPSEIHRLQPCAGMNRSGVTAYPGGRPPAG